MGKRVCWLMLLVLGVLVSISASAGVIRLDGERASYSVHDAADVLEDAGGSLRLADVATGPAAAGFRSSGGGLSSFGFTQSAFWFRFEIDNPLHESRSMLLVLRTNWLDSVRLFEPEEGGGFREHLLGDTLPFDARAHATPQFLIDLQVPPGTHSYYLRLTSEQAFMTPIELWEPPAFRESDRLWSAYYGMFYGILLVMVLYNGFIWAATRDRNYAFYCLYLLAFFLMNFSYSGFAYQYFWPESPRWSNWSHTHWIFLFQAVAILFSMSFLESRARLPRTHRVLRGFLGVMLASWLAVTLLDDPVAYNTAPVYFIFCCTPLILLAGVAAWRNGYRAARFFVLASMASLVGSFFTALTVSGFLSYTFAHFHAAEFGILADVVLLSLALADRINILREQRKAAEQEVVAQKLQAHAMLQQANADLERTVHERTLELSRARDEAERRARIDALTGVANRRHFEEVAAQEFARAQRYGQALSVILFDIDFFKAINDAHGHATGDTVIRRAAVITRETVRESDFVARIGGEEFAILLPGITLEQAVVTAERLRENIADGRPVEGVEAPHFTASLGVSQLDAADSSFGVLLQRTDQAMYAAKLGGRNQVAALTFEGQAEFRLA